MGVGYRVPGDVDDGDAGVASHQEKELEELGALVVEGRLPPVFDDELGDEDGDLALGVVLLELQDVVDQGHEHEAVG